jgi:hypothetical protein
MQYAVIQDLLDTLGPAWPEIQAADRLGNDTWLFALDGERILIVEWLEERQSLLLTTGIGTPAVDRRFDVYESLLCSNSLPENRGVLLALDKPGGELLICGELTGPTQTLVRLHEECVDFMQRAGAWLAVTTGDPDSCNSASISAPMAARLA